MKDIATIPPMLSDEEMRSAVKEGVELAHKEMEERHAAGVPVRDGTERKYRQHLDRLRARAEKARRSTSR
jgi:hypothetical protein